MNRRLSRRSLLESGSLAFGVLIASGAISRTVADEEISEADKIKQMDAHYQRYPKGSAALPDLSAIRPAARQVQDRAGANFSAGLVPVFRGKRECSVIYDRERV